MASDGGQRPQGPPDYKVYRSRRRLLDRLRRPDLSRLRERARKAAPSRRPRIPGGGEDRPGGRPWVRWLLIAAGGWLLLSIAAFALSATIQTLKLDGSAKDALAGGPNMITTGQNILVLGSDARPAGEAEPGATTGGPSRADTIMVVHAGAGSFRKLSIPRDSFAEIPGHDAQKINAAYALGDDDPDDDQGNTALMVDTVEGFLGIKISHVILVDFEGFKDFINALGGVKVKIPEKVCSKIHGGAGNGGFTLLLTRGERVLHGETALMYSRTRKNDCNPAYNDVDRAGAQQRVLSGIKGRLTDPFRFPYNFVKGPIIGWTAPRALISDMGALTMPQLLFNAIVGGNSNAVLKPSANGPGGSLIIPRAEIRREVDTLLKG